MGASGNAKKALVASWSDRGCNDGPGCAGECARPAIGSVVDGVEETGVKQGGNKTKAQSVGDGEARQREDPSGCVQGGDDVTPAADAMQKAFYSVGVDASSKDPRRTRELLVAAAATSIRRHPTVPADPGDPAQPWSRALAEDMAVELPAVHCAFVECTWQSEDECELYEHVHRSARCRRYANC